MRTLIALFLLINSFAMAQNHIPSELPFKSIPDGGTNYSSANLLVRMIEGAGYRLLLGNRRLDRRRSCRTKPSESGQSSPGNP